MDDLDRSGLTESTTTGGISGLTSLEAGLAPEDMKSILEHLQSSLNPVADSDSIAADQDNPLATVQTMLSSKDLTTMTDGGLSSLFSAVLKTLERA